MHSLKNVIIGMALLLPAACATAGSTPQTPTTDTLAVPASAKESELPADLAKLLTDAESQARQDIKAGKPVLLHAVTIRTTGEVIPVEPSVRSEDLEVELRSLMDTLRSQVRDGTIRASVIVAPWGAKPGQGISSVLFDLEQRRGPRFMARLAYDGLGPDVVFGEKNIFHDQLRLFAP